MKPLIDPNVLPPWFHLVFQVGVLLWMLATALASAFRAIPDARYDALDKAFPSFGHWARACRKFGTDVVPFLAELGRAFAVALRSGRDGGPPASGGGAGAIALVCALAAAAGVGAGCTTDAVRVQATVAHQAAQAWNTVGVASVESAYREAQLAAVNAHCPAECTAAQATAAHGAVVAVRAQWAPVFDALEAARAAHDLWRIELEACRAAHDAGCAPDVARLANGFFERATAWRCLVRAMGQARLDFLPGEPACAGAGAALDAGAEVRDAG